MDLFGGTSRTIADIVFARRLPRAGLCRDFAGAVLVALSLTSCAHRTSEAEATGDILKLAAGKWELDSVETTDRADFTCDQTPLIVTVDAAARTYTAHEGDVITEAKVLYEGVNFFWLQYENEKRRNDSGGLLKWAFVLFDDDHFYWVRDDWTNSYPEIPDGSERTAMRRRCE